MRLAAWKALSADLPPSLPPTSSASAGSSELTRKDVLANEGFVAHLAGQRERALGALKECATRFDLPDARVRLAGLYMDLGRLEEARAEIAQVLARESDATIKEYTGNLPFSNDAKRDWYVGLLRAAGLPDG